MRRRAQVLLESIAAAGLVALPAFLPVASAAGAADEGRVRAVLFVSPTCRHCQEVERDALPAFAERFGPRLEIVRVSTGTPVGFELFRTASQRHGLQRPGVPMLLVADRVLLGSQEIPQIFPQLAEELLAAGGSPWPDLPGLEALLAGVMTPPPIAQAAATPAGQAPAPGQLPRPPAVQAPAPSQLPRPPAVPSSSPAQAGGPASAPAPEVAAAKDALPLPAREAGHSGLRARFAADPHGNSLAVVVLVAMTAVMGRSLFVVRRAAPLHGEVPEGWATPVLALLGLGVASYLSWVEIGRTEAVCGPVGDCNTVQESEYATLLGVPIGLLGVLAFAAALALWLAGRRVSGRPRQAAATGLLALTAAGTIFSIYLTFLEPFVIGATCLWCLGSATIMTALYWLSLGAARPAQRPARTR